MCTYVDTRLSLPSLKYTVVAWLLTCNSLEEHIEHLRRIFTILQENGLQINPAKCIFAAAVEFLGHRVDQDSVQPLQRHVQAISVFPPPSGCETITTVFRYGELLQEIPSRYRPHAAAAHRRAQGRPQDAGMAAGRRRRLQSGQGSPGGRGTNGAPSPERRALSRHRRLRHTRRRHASTADRREMAAAGVLLQEAVGGRHQVLHLRQGTAGCLQRGQTFQVLAGGATIPPAYRPQAARHIPVPHNAAMVSPPTTAALVHRRIHLRHPTHTGTGKRGSGCLEPPAFRSRRANDPLPLPPPRTGRRRG
jgi:hypothetical protein